jgi:hypothetical protein
MSHQAVERFVSFETFAPDNNGPREIGIVQGLQCREKDFPTLIPLFAEFGTADRSRLKLLVAAAPGLLAIRSQKVREPGFQISTEVPDEDCGRVPTTRSRLGQFFVSKLADAFVSESLVTPELALN